MLFIIEHMQFGYDAFRFDISILHCLGLQFFRGHSVDKGVWGGLKPSRRSVDFVQK